MVLLVNDYMNPQVSIVKCATYEFTQVLAAVRSAIDLCGGIENFIKPGSRVLVKPNLLIAKSPDLGITTHPAVVRAAVRILKEIGCTVYIGDGPCIWGAQAERMLELFEETGMKKVCTEEGAQEAVFARWRNRGEFSLTSWLDDCDYLVSIPKFKTHDLMVMTGAIKNLFGLVSSNHKMELHRRFPDTDKFAKILVDIYALTKPALTIVDAITAMEGNGPGTSGETRDCGLILAGVDCAAIDSCLAQVMGLSPRDIPTNTEAASRALGQIDSDSIDIRGEPLDRLESKRFKLPESSLVTSIPRPIMNIARALIRFYPYSDRSKCVLCRDCIAACPKEAISKKGKRLFFNYSKCISCFCCQEACPSAAIRVKKSMLARMIGL